MAATRAIGTSLLVVVNLVLAKLLPVTRRQVRTAVLAGFAVGVIDVVVEGIAGALGIWRYHLTGAVLGIPIDVFVDISLVACAVGLGHVAIRERAATWRAGYIAVATLVIGTLGLLHNRQAVGQGIIEFADRVDIDTAWFVVGSYALVLVLVVGTAVAVRVVERVRAG